MSGEWTAREGGPREGWQSWQRRGRGRGRQQGVKERGRRKGYSHRLLFSDPFGYLSLTDLMAKTDYCAESCSIK